MSSTGTTKGPAGEVERDARHFLSPPALLFIRLKGILHCRVKEVGDRSSRQPFSLFSTVCAGINTAYRVLVASWKTINLECGSCAFSSVVGYEYRAVYGMR